MELTNYRNLYQFPVHPSRIHCFFVVAFRAWAKKIWRNSRAQLIICPLPAATMCETLNGTIWTPKSAGTAKICRRTEFNIIAFTHFFLARMMFICGNVLHDVLHIQKSFLFFLFLFNLFFFRFSFFRRFQVYFSNLLRTL